MVTACCTPCSFHISSTAVCTGNNTLAFPKQRVKRHSLNTILKQIMIQMNKYATKIKITVCGLKT